MYRIYLVSWIALVGGGPTETHNKEQSCTDPRTMRKHAAYTEWADAYSCTRHRCQPGGRNLAIYTVGCKRVEAPESAIECEEVVEDTNMQFPFCCTRLRCLVVVRGEVWTRVLGQPWETLPAAPWSHMYKMKKPPPVDTVFQPKGGAATGPVYELTENSNEKKPAEPQMRSSDGSKASAPSGPAPPDIVIALTTNNEKKPSPADVHRKHLLPNPFEMDQNEPHNDIEAEEAARPATRDGNDLKFQEMTSEERTHHSDKKESQSNNKLPDSMASDEQGVFLNHRGHKTAIGIDRGSEERFTKSATEKSAGGQKSWTRVTGEQWNNNVYGHPRAGESDFEKYDNTAKEENYLRRELKTYLPALVRRSFNKIKRGISESALKQSTYESSKKMATLMPSYSTKTGTGTLPRNRETKYHSIFYTRPYSVSSDLSNSEDLRILSLKSQLETLNLLTFKTQLDLYQMQRKHHLNHHIPSDIYLLSKEVTGSEEKADGKSGSLQTLVNAIGTRMRDIESVVQKMSEKVQPLKDDSAERMRQETLTDQRAPEEQRALEGMTGKQKKPNQDNYNRFPAQGSSRYLRSGMESTTEPPMFVDDANMNGYFSDPSNNLLRRSNHPQPKEPSPKTYMVPINTETHKKIETHISPEAEERIVKPKKHSHKKKRTKHNKKKHHKDDREEKKFDKVTLDDVDKNDVSMEENADSGIKTEGKLAYESQRHSARGRYQRAAAMATAIEPVPWHNRLRAYRLARLHSVVARAHKRSLPADYKIINIKKFENMRYHIL